MNALREDLELFMASFNAEMLFQVAMASFLMI